MVDFAAYRALHLRIAKTCCPAATFDLAATEQEVLRDWEEDLHAHGAATAAAGGGEGGGGGGGRFLSHDRFCDASGGPAPIPPVPARSVAAQTAQTL